MDLKKTKTATKKQWTSKLFSLSSGCEQLLFNSQSRTFRILFALPGLGLRLGIQEWAGGCFAWTRRLACPGLHARSRPTLLCGAIECLPGVPVERACLTAPPRAKHVPRPAANFLFTQIPFLATIALPDMILQTVPGQLVPSWVSVTPRITLAPPPFCGPAVTSQGSWVPLSCPSSAQPLL